MIERFEIDVGTLPSRTGVTVYVPFVDGKPAPEQRVLNYMCLDCGFCSRNAEDMTWHQDHQRFYHTRLQRLIRSIKLTAIRWKNIRLKDA